MAEKEAKAVFCGISLQEWINLYPVRLKIRYNRNKIENEGVEHPIFK